MDVTIERPDQPDHQMRVHSNPDTVQVIWGGQVLASSQDVLVVEEASGSNSLSPVSYFPRKAIKTELKRMDGKTTHCPLKGDASYYSLDGETPIAWSYENPLPFSEVLKDRIAFYSDKVSFSGAG